jgi:hypothetical protein
MELTFSIGRILLLVFLILASPSCKNLFSKSLQKEIEENRMVQHLILLILIITLLTMFGNPLNVSNDDNMNNIIIGVIIYVFFILLTKLDLTWNVGILSSIFIYFFYENKKINEIKNISEDNALDAEKKQKLIKDFEKTQQYLLYSIFGLTLLGTGIYYSEKKEQVQMGGGNFDYLNFFFY